MTTYESLLRKAWASPVALSYSEKVSLARWAVENDCVTRLPWRDDWHLPPTLPQLRGTGTAGGRVTGHTKPRD